MSQPGESACKLVDLASVQAVTIRRSSSSSSSSSFFLLTYFLTLDVNTTTSRQKPGVVPVVLGYVANRKESTAVTFVIDSACLRLSSMLKVEGRGGREITFGRYINNGGLGHNRK